MFKKIIEKWKAGEAKQSARPWADKAPEVVLLIIGSGLVAWWVLS
jgi:hypothetical protein